MTSNCLLVGIVGRLNTGKNTLASTLVSEGFKARAFADPLKEIIHDLFDIPKEQLWGPSEMRKGEIREMLQVLGTDYARKFRPSIWIDKMSEYLDSSVEDVVITDVRFTNEAEFIVSRGGYLIRVTRPGLELNSHPSEQESNTIPTEMVYAEVENSGTLEDLKKISLEILESIRNEPTRK